MNNVQIAIEEVNRKATRKNNRQVSSEDGFKDDMKNHNYGNTVVNEIETIISLFIDRQDFVLRSKHNAHELTGPLTGLSHCICIRENTVTGIL